MKKYIVKNKHTQECVGTFTSQCEMTRELFDFIENHNEYLNEGDEKYLTPFDFDCEISNEKEINKQVVDFESAIKFLNEDAKRVENVQFIVDYRHAKALDALNTLITIASAWNKADGFVPDYSNRRQDKWYPWFIYDNDTAGFVYAATPNAPTYAHAAIGSRLCFKTADRARQFGKQFIDLWNDFLLFR